MAQARLLTAAKQMAAESAVRVLVTGSGGESDEGANAAATADQGQAQHRETASRTERQGEAERGPDVSSTEHSLQKEWQSVQRRIVRLLFVSADAANESSSLPLPPALGHCFMASASCGMQLSTAYAITTDGCQSGTKQRLHEYGVDQASGSDSSTRSDTGGLAALRQLLDMVGSSRGPGGRMRPWVEASIAQAQAPAAQQQCRPAGDGSECTQQACLRRAALIVACHCHSSAAALAAPVPAPVLATPQRRLLGLLPLLSATFYSSDREDLTVGLWQTVAERLLNHVLPLRPAVHLRLRPFALESRGAGMVPLLHSLLVRCTGSDAQSRLSPENATKQVKLIETVLTNSCALEDQLWLLPALLLRAAGGGSTLTLSSVLVVQRLVLRACTAAVREIKRLHGQPLSHGMESASAVAATALRIRLLGSRVVGLHSLVAHCLADAAHGGLGGQIANDTSAEGINSDCAFDCAAFVRGADMIVGALSILRIVTAYTQWAANTHSQVSVRCAADGDQHRQLELAEQQRQNRQATLASVGAGEAEPARAVAPSPASQAATVSAWPSSVPESVCGAVPALLNALRLRVETYGAALARLEQHTEAPGGDSGSGLGVARIDNVSQAVATLQMVLQAIDGASEQLQLHD